MNLAIDITENVRQTKEQRFGLAHGLLSFSPWSVDSSTSGPVLRQNNITEVHHEGKLLTTWDEKSEKVR